MRRVALDIETTGLDPRRDRLVLVALAEGGQVEVYDAWRDLAGIRSLLEQRLTGAEVVVHRSTFDLVWLAVVLGLPLPARVWDTWLAEQILLAGTGQSASLAAACERRLGVTLDKELQTSLVGTDGTEVTQEMRAYAARDTGVLLPLADAQAEALKSAGLERIWAIEQDALPAFLGMMVRGLPMDPARLAAVIGEERERTAGLRKLLVERLGPHAEDARLAKLDAEQARLEAWLEEREHVRALAEGTWGPDIPGYGNTRKNSKGQPIGLANYVRDAVKAWARENPCPPKPKAELEPFNPDSPEQVRAAFAGLGYDLESVDRETLLVTEFDGRVRREFVEPLLDYRKSSKLVTAFGDPLLATIQGGRVYPDINPAGTASGRPTSSSPNLLQLPRATRFRQVVVAPPGHKLIVCDYSQMELRLMAELSADPVLTDSFRSGNDVHLETAIKLFGPGAGKAERDLAKTVNYLIQYGGGAERLAQQAATGGIQMDQREAKQIIDDWKRLHRRLWATIERWRAEAVRTREARTPWGRRRRFPADLPPHRVARAGANHRIQGANADITKVAMAVIERELVSLGGGVLLQIYDEILAEAPEGQAERAARIVEAAMRAAAELLLREVPAEVDCAVGDHWGIK